jgi:hypothetical protein
MVDYLNKFSFPDIWNMKRVPVRPLELQVMDFAKNYDYNTVWVDAIQLNPNTIHLIGPPLYSAAKFLGDNCFFYDEQGRRLGGQVKEMDRTAVLALRTQEINSSITLATPYSIHTLPLSRPNGEFNDKKVIVTVSKDNPIPWIVQWIDYYKVVHGIEGILFYNNRSTIYTSQELESAISRSDMTIRVVDYAVPYGALGGGLWEWEGKSGTSLPWDSDFAQYTMFEHAKWKYLHSAKIVINADVDELVSFRDTTLDELAENLQTSEISVYTYEGVWIEPVNHATGEIAENVPYDLRKFDDYWLTSYNDHRGVPIKWIMNPRKNLQYQWRPHNTNGPYVVTDKIIYGHYLSMNTSWTWKRDVFTGDIKSLVPHPETRDNLIRWQQGKLV